MYRRFQDAQLRKTLPQQHGQHLTDRIFGLKVARVDQIQPAPARFLKLMVFEIRRHERITARRKHLIDRAAAAPAANGDTPHRSSGVGEPQPRTGQLFLHKRCKRPHIRLFLSLIHIFRHHFDKYGGSLGVNGCVSWAFDKKGVIVIDNEEEDLDEDAVMMDALDAGAADFQPEEGCFTVYTDPNDFNDVAKALEDKGYKFESAQIEMVPQNYQKLDKPEDIANKMCIRDRQ